MARAFVIADANGVMATLKCKKPETDTDKPKLSENENLPRFGSKKDVAALIGMSPRSVDLYMQRGMPHLKLTARKTRFDLEEVAQWFKAQFTIKRLGKVSA